MSLHTPHQFTISCIIGNLVFFTTIFGFVVIVIKLYLFSFDKFKAVLNLNQPLSLVRHHQENHILKQHTTVAATARPPIGKPVPVASESYPTVLPYARFHAETKVLSCVLLFVYGLVVTMSTNIMSQRK